MNNLRDKIIGYAASAAIAASATLGSLAPAFAQEAQTPESIDLAELSAPIQIITAAEALERSNGKILLHYGSDFSPAELASTIRTLKMTGVDIEAYAGGKNGSIEMYFFGNYIPKVFSQNETGELYYIAKSLIQKYQLSSIAPLENDSL